MIIFRTVSGRRINLEDPQVADINIEDIASGLSNLCRFTGQLRRFYSVAQHALLVAELVDPSVRFAALNHDDSEALLGDVSRHLKHSHYLGGYRILEARMQHTIEQALGICPTDWQRAQIKLADDVVAIVEQAVLRDEEPWDPERHVIDCLLKGFVHGDGTALLQMAARVPERWQHELLLHPLSPRDARWAFLKQFAQER